nr:immunoglobulin light chain junction region [Macaca mulatta]MOV74655.1 immunoglobulin light chain junction region [Macaca mulatta]MOV74777.1 immunoglobulin light chain junction region [Macaca mulatta]MOV75018.1 immunoglobulin light chain junction region [Macaca mulatta]MOV75041.1 immunoglobulin light chain junction region [Macaca mulatta]
CLQYNNKPMYSF